MKNSSRIEETIPQNLTRSRSGSPGSAASSSTRRIRSSCESSRFRNGGDGAVELMLRRGHGRTAARRTAVNRGFDLVTASHAVGRTRMLPPCGMTVSSPRSPSSSAIALIVIAIVYWVEPAKSLPGFFPGPRSRLGPPPCEARHRGVLRRARVPRLRLVPDRARSARTADVIARRADLLPPGDRPRAAPGGLRALPDLEPRAQRHPPEAARLEHPSERPVLPDVPRRDAPGHGDRAARVLLARLGADPERARPVAPRPRDRPGRRRREARLAARRRHDPGRDPRADARALAAQASSPRRRRHRSS